MVTLKRLREFCLNIHFFRAIKRKNDDRPFGGQGQNIFWKELKVIIWSCNKRSDEVDAHVRVR